MTSRFPDLPDRMKRLPVDHRGFPVPWFVAWSNGEPVFPTMDGSKIMRAWRNRRCWICGEPLGRLTTFVVGPMCIVNRISSEPPSHLECARFSAKHCPFLTKPRMSRVPHDKLPDAIRNPAGEMIERNPGATVLWTTKKPGRIQVENGSLFDIGPPESIEWWAEGRLATREEAIHAIETGVPTLADTIKREPPHQREQIRADLDRRVAAAMALVP